MAKPANFDVLVSTLIRTFTSGQSDAPTVDEITVRATALAPLLGFEGSKGDIALAVDEALLSIDVRMGLGHSLVDQAAEHDADWVRKRDFPLIYTGNYSSYLRENNWNSTVVSNLEIVTENILGLLQDPADDGQWSRRGLVIGHVQSGKTANYLGLVARAADAGYKFIVIVAGIHNNLRKQTQERVDEGFVGRTSDPADKRLIGVGLYPGHPQPVTLTTILDDFKKGSRTTGSGLKDWSKPVVVVIKKNVSTLKQIMAWLKDFNLSAGQKQIADAPMLFIDDEADNASVNTNKDDVDPTQTNKLIREILKLFKKNCYVGYTATPFANIFINPDAYGDPETLEDLFPRDFIYCLDAPTTYFGAEKIFGDDIGAEAFLREIVDAEDIIPLKHNKGISLSELPGSLKRALLTFVLTRAIRNVRGQSHKHCSMLINASRFVAVQQTLRALVSDYVKVVTDAIRTNYALPEKLCLQNHFMAALKDVFDHEYSDISETWAEVCSQLDIAAQAVRLFVVNSSKSDEALDYAAYDKKKESLTAIAIGGLSLSRGLTIEGLTVSYMYRNTKMYDTLLQMGRWFGYRPGYEDVCRIYLSPESIGWYQHIAKATEELRDRVKQMRQYGKSPKDFGLLVQSHPDALLVTAVNKMRHAEERTFKVSYDGMLRETFVLSNDPSVHDENRAEYGRLYAELSSDAYKSLRYRGGVQKIECPVWRGVDADVVDAFLNKFRWHAHHANTQELVRKYLGRIRDRFPTWDIAFMTLKKEQGKPINFDDFKMVAQYRGAGVKDEKELMRSDEGPGYFVTGKQRVAGTGDERVGLNAEELAMAEKLARENDDRKKGPTDLDFRNVNVRGRPLLMLHLIDLRDDRSDPSVSLLQNAPAIGVSFPATGDFVQVDYVLNKVMIGQLAKEANDLPEEDEDQDD
ncbi:Z1 domain protein [Asticcacaulis biprosthecium C19]|uniref:Z1 domain protein n=1 Tax=Asticcacaulis biprosthecium C19 TaxID=715226 RepID=F4QRV9_9CAUL|nr:Z1 domain-containing protein [Asticcacaulis biprosthecium]EGF89479.1 Z1 domain protein [Asticcacaulis biprosthecium C19]